LTLLEVQAKDSTIAQLEHRRTALPEHERIAALTAEARELSGQHVEAETEVGDLERAQRKFDVEVDQVRQRRVRDEQRMSSGAITNPKDLASLQHELGALDRRISTLEDEELEIMEQLEEAQGRLASITKDVDRVQADLERETAARDAAIADIESDVAVARIARDGLASGLPADLIALYEKVRGQHSGLGAAALRARRCEGCRLEINGADLRELAGKADDEVLRCPECSRILVRTAESGL
jgi:predicted  nucleic acid-binding Zn-ribbon protein